MSHSPSHWSQYSIIQKKKKKISRTEVQIKLLAFEVFASQLLMPPPQYIGKPEFHICFPNGWDQLVAVLGSNLMRNEKQRFSHLFNIVSFAVPSISVKLPRIGRAPVLCSIWAIC